MYKVRLHKDTPDMPDVKHCCQPVSRFCSVLLYMLVLITSYLLLSSNSQHPKSIAIWRLISSGPKFGLSNNRQCSTKASSRSCVGPDLPFA